MFFYTCIHNRCLCFQYVAIIIKDKKYYCSAITKNAAYYKRRTQTISVYNVLYYFI